MPELGSDWAVYRTIDQGHELGVPAGPFTGAHVIDVDRLSPRDLGALAERLQSPSPILVDRTRDHVPWAAATLLLSLAALVGLAACHFGDVNGFLATESAPSWPLLYATIGAIALASVTRLAVAIRFAGWRALPQGTFLFPLDLLVVSGRRVRVTPFGDARRATIDEEARSVTITYVDGSTVTLSGERASKASLLSELLSAQHSLEDGTNTGSSNVDVLASIRSAGWEAVEAREEPRVRAPSATTLHLAVAALVGAGFGVVVWYGREVSSDDAMYRSARASDTSLAYVRYLERGTRHVADVTERWLPGALRREAGDKIGLLDRVIRTYPASPQVDLAKDSLHHACEDYAHRAVPASTPTNFDDDTAVEPEPVRGRSATPRMVDTCGIGSRPPPSGMPVWVPDRSESAICAAELEDARLDDLVRLGEPVKLWAYVHANTDPKRVGEARAAAGRALDALIANVRAPEADPEVQSELVALLEVARVAERPAVVLIDDRTGSRAVGMRLPLRGAVTLDVPGNGGATPDAIWTFTNARDASVIVAMVRGEHHVTRSFDPIYEGEGVVRGFLEYVVRWPLPPPMVRVVRNRHR